MCALALKNTIIKIITLPTTSNNLLMIFLQLKKIRNLFVLILVLILTMTQIDSFMKVLETCADDFAIIERCGCVPWWK